MKTKYITLACIVCLATGFVIGRKTVPDKTEIKYVKGAIIRDTIPFPIPIREIVHDTIRLVEYDTVRTLIDWNTERFYTERLFSDNKGVLDISATIQFNKLQNFSYEFLPIYKEITIYKEPLYVPFVGMSYNSLNYVTLSGGLFRKDVGVELQYVTNFRQKGFGLGIKYKF